MNNLIRDHVNNIMTLSEIEVNAMLTHKRKEKHIIYSKMEKIVPDPQAVTPSQYQLSKILGKQLLAVELEIHTLEFAQTIYEVENELEGEFE